MTLLAPAADRVVREAVDAVLEGRTKPGAGADVSFATRSSRYRVIHGVLKEASDSSLVGSRFVGWLFDGGREPRVSERWDSDARAVLIDGVKGQIVVTSLTRVHVSNAVPVLPETVVEPAATQSSETFPTRAGTLHGLPAVGPEPSQEVSFSDIAAPEPRPAAPAAQTAPDGGAQSGAAVEAPVVATPSPPQVTSPVPKRTIPPAPPIPGRQATPIPAGRPQTPLMPMGLPPPPRSTGGQHPTTHQGLAPSPFAPPAPASTAAPATGPTAAALPRPSSRGLGGPPPPPPPRAPSTHLGLAPATRFPPAPPAPAVDEGRPADGSVDLASIEEVSAQLSMTGELSVAVVPQVVGAPPSPPDAESAAPDAPVAPEPAPGWAGKSAPLPQFDLDDADLDLPTRADPMPPAPPSEEDAVIPLIPRN